MHRKGGQCKSSTMLRVRGLVEYSDFNFQSIFVKHLQAACSAHRNISEKLNYDRPFQCAGKFCDSLALRQC